MRYRSIFRDVLLLAVGGVWMCAAVPAEAQQRKPNILFIMGDDIGWFQIGAYHRGIMSGKTPNLDKLAGQSVLFTKAYCSAPACNPSRASLMCGVRPSTSGVYHCICSTPIRGSTPTRIAN